MTERTNADWEAVEREYRAGQLSVTEIARQHGISHTAVQKRAKKYAWPRDLTARVRKEVATRLVAPEVAETNVQQAIDVAAARGVELVRQHRKDLSTGRSLIQTLMDQLAEASANVSAIEDEIATETAGDRDAKRRALMMRAVSLPSRAGTIKDLSAALKNIVPLERQAFSLDAGAESSDDFQRLDDAQRAHRIAAILERGRARRDGPASDGGGAGVAAAAGAADRGL